MRQWIGWLTFLWLLWLPLALPAQSPPSKEAPAESAVAPGEISAESDNQAPPASASPAPDTPDRPLTVDDILDRVEKRYAGTGFSARFKQESTIKAMQITDKAVGKLFVRYPGMMRWEYEKPERQVIISDGETLWIYTPADKQVMIGTAPTFFGGGKGASFLSDVRLIRENFQVSRARQREDKNNYVLKLIPKQAEDYDITEIYLSISKKTHDVVAIVSYNSYEDETRITMRNFQFNLKFDESVFNFVIPEGAEVLQLEERSE
jgi:outer membrane lipoprotein carrier protein